MRRYSYFILQDVKAEHLEGPGSNGITVQIHVESVSGMLWNMQQRYALRIPPNVLFS